TESVMWFLLTDREISMKVDVETLAQVMRAISPNYETISTLAKRTQLRRTTVATALSEARSRGYVFSLDSANKGYQRHVIQNPGREFLAWIADGQLRGYVR